VLSADRINCCFFTAHFGGVANLQGPIEDQLPFLRQMRRFGFAIIEGAPPENTTVLELGASIGVVRTTNYGARYYVSSLFLSPPPLFVLLRHAITPPPPARARAAALHTRALVVVYSGGGVMLDRSADNDSGGRARAPSLDLIFVGRPCRNHPAPLFN